MVFSASSKLAFSYLGVKSFETTSTCCLSIKKHVIPGISVLENHVIDVDSISDYELPSEG